MKTYPFRKYRSKPWKQGILIVGFFLMILLWNLLDLTGNHWIFAGEAAQAEDEENPKVRMEPDGTDKEEAGKQDAPQEMETEGAVILPNQKVSAEYFEDSLFIGDSRVAGLAQYVPELDEKATFYAQPSLTIYKLLEAVIAEGEDGSFTVEEGLEKNTFGKIYIMVGINEIGVGNPKYFQRHYRKVLNRIMQLQPEADIYLQGIMHVTESKSSADQVYSNAAIDERNQAIREIADENLQDKIYYINMNESTDDETGSLCEDLTADGVHLKASGYPLWYEFLKNHGV